MPPVALSSDKEFQIDVANLVFHATRLELKLREAEEYSKTLHALLTSVGGHLRSVDDEELEVADIAGITEAKDDNLLEIRRLRSQLAEVVVQLQGYHEMAFADLQLRDMDESLQHYANELISWVQLIRSPLIEFEKSALELKEKKEKTYKAVQENSDAMATMWIRVERTKSALDRIVQRQKPRPSVVEPTVTPPNAMSVDDGSPHPTSDSDTSGIRIPALLEEMAKLRDFCDSSDFQSSKITALQNHITTILQLSTPGNHLIKPVQNIEVSSVVLGLNIREIIATEFNLQCEAFQSSLTEELYKNEQVATSKLTNLMVDANKLVENCW